jgi:hypothetical protein
MLLDNAIYHHFKGIAQWLLDEVENISLMYFPSYWSDLNSIEHLWKDTRSNVTHNTFFETFDLMVDNPKEYMANLKLLPGKLTKLCKAIYYLAFSKYLVDAKAALIQKASGNEYSYPNPAVSHKSESAGSYS